MEIFCIATHACIWLFILVLVFKPLKASAYCCASKYFYANVPDQLRQKYIYENMAESVLLCVRVATLLRCKDASTLRVMLKGSACSQYCLDFCFVFQHICLVIATSKIKNIDIALAITLVKTS